MTGAAAGLFWAMSLTSRWMAGGSADIRPLQAISAVAVTALTIVLVPVAVRLLARPRAIALPPQARAGALAGLATALGCLVTGLAATAVDGLVRGADGGPLSARLLVLVLAVLTAVATAAGAGRLLAARTGDGHGGDPAGRSGDPAGRSGGTGRPDLVDDLALLSARALPGSPTARGLAWLNRGLDRWRWSPRLRSIARARPLRTGRAQPQPE